MPSWFTSSSFVFTSTASLTESECDPSCSYSSKTNPRFHCWSCTYLHIDKLHVQADCSPSCTVWISRVVYNGFNSYMKVSWKAYLWKTPWNICGQQRGILRPASISLNLAACATCASGPVLPVMRFQILGHEGWPDLEGKISVSFGRQTYGEWWYSPWRCFNAWENHLWNDMAALGIPYHNGGFKEKIIYK